MIIAETKDFSKELKKLPKETRNLFQKQKTFLKNNWLDSRLHTKRVKELPGVYSFRITRRYRAFFYFQSSDKIILFSIGHRKDAYQF